MHIKPNSALKIMAGSQGVITQGIPCLLNRRWNIGRMAIGDGDKPVGGIGNFTVRIEFGNPVLSIFSYRM